ncbi:MAG: hypothetical protein ACK5GU_04620 [Chloroflexota bacterium]|jgi:hypothetical protein
MTSESPSPEQSTEQPAQSGSPEQRVRRGCNFIIGLFAVLTAINALSVGGFNNLAVQVLAGLFVVSVIVRIVLSRDVK